MMTCKDLAEWNLDVSITNFIVLKLMKKEKCLILITFEGLLKDEFYIMLNYSSEQLNDLKK
ncbi:hypothetical protein KHA80_14810 [Anaerobacillus sp. HL2]|nr:hypothetical protein KHA80_14810 [Anaerobacillus sp. HL2]